MITRTPFIDDPAGFEGTVFDSAWWTQQENMIDGRWSTLFSGPSGIQNNYPVGEADYWQLSNTAALHLTGIAAPANPPKPGKPFYIASQGTAPVFLYHADGRSVAANRFVNPVTVGPMVLGAGGSATYVYHGGIWVLVEHLQGAWVAPAFAAGDYLTSTAGVTWQVVAGNVPLCKYLQRGKSMRLQLTVVNSSIVGGAAGTIVRALPNGWTGMACPFVLGRFTSNAVVQTGMAQIGGGGINMWGNIGGAGWPAAAGNNGVELDIEVELT